MFNIAQWAQFYRDLREALKRLYPGYTVQQLSIVLDYLGGYNRSLIEENGTLVRYELPDYCVNTKNGYIARIVRLLKIL